MCSAAKEWGKDDVPDGVCLDCEMPTLDGEAFEACYYSPVECETCGWAHGAQSC